MKQKIIMNGTLRGEAVTAEILDLAEFVNSQPSAPIFVTFTEGNSLAQVRKEEISWSHVTTWPYVDDAEVGHIDQVYDQYEVTQDGTTALIPKLTRRMLESADKVVGVRNGNRYTLKDRNGKVGQ